jgi:dihydroorotate dehydrogenase
MLWPIARSLLFRLDPETAHDITLKALDSFGWALPRARPAGRPSRVMGLDFPNRVGLAAGLDKNGAHIDALARLGFGFLEVGTVTPRPQPGNPRPRMFRIPQARAVINRMGFNNLGVDRLVRNVDATRYRGILGINIGKNFDTPIDRAVDDYLHCFDKVYPYADYVTVNISSPNTRNLRDLQGAAELDRLLGSMDRRRDELADMHGRHVPLAVKVAPDLDDEQIPVIAEVAARHRMDAVIATNTTVSREGVEGMQYADEAGGLSGAPLKPRADHVLGSLRQALPAEVALIGVGGITCGQDAVDKLDLGAQLVQFYTGMVYRGPELVGECLRAIAERNGG